MRARTCKPTRTISGHISTRRRDGIGKRAICSVVVGLAISVPISIGTPAGHLHWCEPSAGADARPQPQKILAAKSLEEQRKVFESELAPLFEKRHIRWLLDQPSALFGLGIPPSQFEALKGKKTHMSNVVHQRLGRLACGFDLSDNYFAWQAFGRRYATDEAGPLPPYLRRENFDNLRARVGDVEVQHRSFTEHLASKEAASLDAYVLLDAQDWMTDEILNDLWGEIERTARPVRA